MTTDITPHMGQLFGFALGLAGFVAVDWVLLFWRGAPVRRRHASSNLRR